MPYARQQTPAAAVHVRVAGVAVAMGVPVRPVRGMSVRVRRLGRREPENVQSSGH